MSDRGALLGLVGGAVALGLVWWSPSFGGETPAPTGESELPASGSGSSSADGPAPASLAAATLTHLDPADVTGLAGTPDVGGPLAQIDLGDTMYLVSVWQDPRRPRCLHAATACTTLADGAVVSWRRGGRAGDSADLVGQAFRADGSVLSLEVYGDLPDLTAARAILEDDEVGWTPSAETVAAGQTLDLDAIDVSMTVSSARPTR